MPAIDQSGVMDIVSGIDNLPTPPIVFSRINEAIGNPNASAYQIASLSPRIRL